MTKNQLRCVCGRGGLDIRPEWIINTDAVGKKVPSCRYFLRSSGPRLSVGHSYCCSLLLWPSAMKFVKVSEHSVGEEPEHGSAQQLAGSEIC